MTYIAKVNDDETFSLYQETQALDPNFNTIEVLNLVDDSVTESSVQNIASAYQQQINNLTSSMASYQANLADAQAQLAAIQSATTPVAETPDNQPTSN